MIYLCQNEVNLFPCQSDWYAYYYLLPKAEDGDQFPSKDHKETSKYLAINIEFWNWKLDIQDSSNNVSEFYNR